MAELYQPFWTAWQGGESSPAPPPWPEPTGIAVWRGRKHGGRCDQVIAALVHGTSYERLASPGCLDRRAGTVRSLERVCLPE